MRKFIGLLTILIASYSLVFFVFLAHDPIVQKTITKTSSGNEVYENVTQENPRDRSVIVLFGGDMMFDRYIRQMGKGKDYQNIFSAMRDRLNDVDCVVANLEGPVTDNISVSIDSEIGSPENYRFTFDPLVLSMLKNDNFCLVNIGNNHIGNFGKEGINLTKERLVSQGISYIGDTGIADEKRYFVKNIKGVKLAFINFNAFTSDGYKNTINDISDVRGDVDFLIVYTHWGEEYRSSIRSQEQKIAHTLIDHGADLIIGSHPHVIQEQEVYKGKRIYYSLGNFVFDQYFSPETMAGLLIAAHFNAEEQTISFEEIDIEMTKMGETRFVK